MLPLIHELLKTTFRAAAGGSVAGATFKLPAYRHISIYWSKLFFFFLAAPSCGFHFSAAYEKYERKKIGQKTSNFLPRVWRFFPLF